MQLCTPATNLGIGLDTYVNPSERFLDRSALREGKTKFFTFFFIGASAKKGLQGQGFSGMGCLKIF